jgi:hypothetical protein
VGNIPPILLPVYGVAPSLNADPQCNFNIALQVMTRKTLNTSGSRYNSDVLIYASVTR